MSQTLSVGHGGEGISFVEYFGTNVGDNGYFAGGGGGGSYGYKAYGNGGNGLYGGGGEGNYTGGSPGPDASGSASNGTSGISNTGGGGGGYMNSGPVNNGGSGIVIIRFSRYDKTPLQPNYGLYTVLPWNQHNIKDIKDIVSFKVWNETAQKYELPTTDFVFDKELMDMSKTPNYTGLYTFDDTDDEYYLYTFKYLDTIPVQTFEYKLTAEGMTAYIFEKSHDRKDIHRR